MSVGSSLSQSVAQIPHIQVYPALSKYGKIRIPCQFNIWWKLHLLCEYATLIKNLPQIKRFYLVLLFGIERKASVHIRISFTTGRHTPQKATYLPQADPGGPWGLPPCPQDFFQNHAVFRKFWANFGSQGPPPGEKTPLGPPDQNPGSLHIKRHWGKVMLISKPCTVGFTCTTEACSTGNNTRKASRFEGWNYICFCLKLMFILVFFCFLWLCTK